MPQVLLILDESAGFEAARSVQQIKSALSSGFGVSVHRIAQGSMRSLLSRVRGLRSEAEYDLVHAWGSRALAAAVLGTRGAVIYSPPRAATARTARWLAAIQQYRPVQVVCATATQRHMLMSRGLAPEKCHVIRPGVEFGRVRARRDARLRMALGFSDDDIVLLASGESDAHAGHREAVWAGSILHTLDPRWRVLLWGRGPQAQTVWRFGRNLGTPREVVLAEQTLGRTLEFEDLLPAADLVLATATGPVATLPVAIAMAAALPIVATATAELCELLEDRHTAFLVGDDAPPSVVARKALELREDASLQWKLADMARTEAYEYFSSSRFLDQWRSMYRQVSAGGAVELPQVTPGAGSRFAGRA